MVVVKHGGKRNGSGRKPHTDKKEALFIYVPGSVLAFFGGKENAKKYAEQALQRKAKNSLK